MKRRITGVCAVLLLSVLSCGEEAPLQTVPFAQVYLRIDLNGLDFDLAAPLAYKIFTTPRTAQDKLGFAGLMVVRNEKGDNLFAYDLACPYEDSKSALLKPTGDGKAVCPTCGSVFVTMYGLGSVESGPAKEPLQRYTVVPGSSGEYIIRN